MPVGILHVRMMALERPHLTPSAGTGLLFEVLDASRAGLALTGAGLFFVPRYRVEPTGKNPRSATIDH